MKRVILNQDKAVSPIIGTVLLVAITVTLAATLYTLLIPYFDNSTTPTPQATLIATNKTSAGTSGITGYYTLYVNSINENVSTDFVGIVVTTSDGQVYNINSLSAVALSGNNGTDVIPNNNTMTISLLGPKTYLNTDSSLKFMLNDSLSFVTRIALVDLSTNGVMGSIVIQ